MSIVAAKPTVEPGSPELVKGLRLFDSTTIVMGSMIGSGIFIVSAEISREVGSPGMLLLAWVASGLMTVIGAVTYGELAAMMPRAGGQYVYLRESLSPLFGFLYGWTLFLVIQTGTIAAVAVAFGKFLGVFFPWVSAGNILVNLGTVTLFGRAIALTFSSQQFVAIVVLLGLAVINILGLRAGAWVQNVFTTLKVAALLGIVFIGLWWGFSHAPAATGAQGFWQGAHWDLATLTVLSVALVGPLFSSDAWNNVTFTGAEVVNPKRNLPLALFMGTATVCTLYFLCNWVYLRVLPFAGSPQGVGPLARGIQYAAEDRVATAAMQVIFGSPGASLMAAAIIISTFGCMNGLTLAGARVYYAMAKDGLFFHSVGKVNSKYHTPAVSLLVQGVWASLLTLSGTYNELLNYVIFAAVLFYMLTILGLFRLRRTRPDAPRPYRAWGYPVVPGLYLVFALFVEWALLTHKAAQSLAGLSIVALGVPVFYLWQRRSRGIVARSD
ncbi:MAG TPA: amino acid permease [Terriglobia bacterium]|nr:amino acid permease [Terriglobia bacterium]